MFICGSGNFNHQEEGEPENLKWSPSSTPKRSKKGTSFFKSKNKNPYADRGLDKFHALLADLDEKRQKIYTQDGSEDIAFVRFVYPNSNDEVKPIVVKVKEKKELEKKPNNNVSQILTSHSPAGMVFHPPSDAPSVGLSVDKPTSIETLKPPSAPKKYCMACRNFRWRKLRQPYYYLPMIIIFILVLLLFYGRSFAILCTSIGWYLIPTIKGESSKSRTIKGESSKSRRAKRKKIEYERRLSDKKIEKSYEGSSSPTSVIDGLMDHKSPRKHGLKRSW